MPIISQQNRRESVPAFFLGGRVGTDPGFVGLEALQFGGEGLFMKLSALGNTLIWLLLGH